MESIIAGNNWTQSNEDEVEWETNESKMEERSLMKTKVSYLCFDR